MGRARNTNVIDGKASAVKHNGEKGNLVDLNTDVRIFAAISIMYSITEDKIIRIELGLRFINLVSERHVYMSYRTANLQILHLIYLFNKYTYRIF